MIIGDTLRKARQRAGLQIADVAVIGNVSRGHLCNVEKGRRGATPAVLRAYEKALGMDRRVLLRIAGAALGSVLVGTERATAVARDLYATIVAGDDGPLGSVQTSHAVDHLIQRLAVREAPAIGRLQSWMKEGADPVLRVNAAGILAKTGNTDLADEVAITLGRDPELRTRYLSAVVARTGDTTEALRRELTNPADSGARWCAAYLLAGTGRGRIVLPAMRTEPSKENLRAMALAAMGPEDACD